MTTHIPNDLFSSSRDETLAKKIVNKLGMKGHDKGNPASLSQIKGYLGKSYADSKIRSVLKSCISSKVSLNGSISNDKFWATKAFFNDPFIDF